MKQKFWHLRADPLFKEKLDIVMREKIKNGTSKIEDIKVGKLSYTRLTLAIARDEKLLNDLINAKLI